MLGNVIGSKLIELDETDSTNSYASRLIFDQSPIEGTVIMAGYQSAGKGQRGSGWESLKQQNLLISYILYPTFLPADQHFLLNQALSISVFEFISRNTTAPVSIKWPNDVLVGNKKIAGLLIENSIRNNKFSSSVAGIGININQIIFKEYSLQATSLQLIENKIYDVKSCLSQLNSQIDKWYAILKSGNHKKITEYYEKALYGIGSTVGFDSKGENFNAVIKGVNASGQLVLTKNSGDDVVYNNKELKYKF